MTDSFLRFQEVLGLSRWSLKVSKGFRGSPSVPGHRRFIEVSGGFREFNGHSWGFPSVPQLPRSLPKIFKRLQGRSRAFQWRYRAFQSCSWGCQGSSRLSGLFQGELISEVLHELSRVSWVFLAFRGHSGEFLWVSGAFLRVSSSFRYVPGVLKAFQGTAGFRALKGRGLQGCSSSVSGGCKGFHGQFK